MSEGIITGVFTIIAAAVGSVLTWLGTRSKERERKQEEDLRKLRVELKATYNDLLELWYSEDTLINMAGISKKEARKNRNISKRAEPARITQRIRELNDKIETQ